MHDDIQPRDISDNKRIDLAPYNDTCVQTLEDGTKCTADAEDDAIFCTEHNNGTWRP